MKVTDEMVVLAERVLRERLCDDSEELGEIANAMLEAALADVSDPELVADGYAMLLRAERAKVGRIEALADTSEPTLEQWHDSEDARVDAQARIAELEAKLKRNDAVGKHVWPLQAILSQVHLWRLRNTDVQYPDLDDLEAILDRDTTGSPSPSARIAKLDAQLAEARAWRSRTLESPAIAAPSWQLLDAILEADSEEEDDITHGGGGA